MANTFKSSLNKNIGTAPVSVYTVPVGTATTLIGGNVSNNTASQITANVYITRGGVDYYIVQNASIPVGASLVFVGSDQKIVLMASDILKIATSVTSGGDSTISYLEVA